MIIFPAVDIKDGQCVRLKQGLARESTVFADDPLEMARHWQDQGAAWLHIIDLDGAFDGRPVNLELIKNICSQLNLSVQVGGGIRDAATARRYLEAGVSRVIIGTMALRQPDLYAEICAAFPGRVGVSLDARDGRLKTRGWVEDSGLTVREVLPRLLAQGTAFIIYTDIERDGMQSGVNLEAVTWLARNAGVPVIAAGGVTALADVRALYPLSLHWRLEGLITGRAIYEGTLKLREALAWVEAQKKMGSPSVYG
ncbi:MAG: 1-(5-phosphoribosyl)-5-[(5-phosphoribosylamino)methylideneamino]imidazole-4-carboxamide isomerase [Deltaproteobacteria bacterium]|jgi:phosphoribosylformimino-5-aminoimidazole carboxamide ribotide isomerase|nr:1-(5-phosphoribosyl)-5-[(5-phosphoribosylamino)methylideneamino]imidazole-4-carboxamide isomerase [Deltaproteobacteria bacterium]